MYILITVNTIWSFFLEVAVILATGYWGFTARNIGRGRFLLGIFTPLIIIIAWGIWCAPQSESRLSNVPLALIKTVVFLIAAYCLYKREHHILSVVLFVSFAANLALNYIFTGKL